MQEVAKLSSSAAAGTSRSTMDFSNGGSLSVPPAVVSSSTAENKKDSRRRAASEAAASSAPSFQWETFSYPNMYDSSTAIASPTTGSSSNGPAQMKILSLQSEVQRLKSCVANMHHSLDRANSSSELHKQVLQQRLQLSEQENATLRQEVHDLRTLLELEEEARIVDHLSSLGEHDKTPSVPQEVRVGATLEMETNHTLVMEKTNAASTEPQEMPEQVQQRDFGNLAA